MVNGISGQNQNYSAFYRAAVGNAIVNQNDVKNMVNFLNGQPVTVMPEPTISEITVQTLPFAAAIGGIQAFNTWKNNGLSGQELEDFKNARKAGTAKGYNIKETIKNVRAAHPYTQRSEALKSGLDNLKKEYGYVDMTLCTNPKQAYDILGYLDSELFADYPDLKIKGPRVIIDYLQNWNDSRYGAIGRLADKISVKHCLDNGIKPVILSVADCDSHVAHYLRGKRFLPLEPESNAFEFFTKKYGSSDVNEILENLIAQSQNSGGKVDLKNWGFTPMYMPEELAHKYVKELQSEKK